jgi:hypothetical protein
MPRQKACRLGADHPTLDAAQRRLSLVERQTDRLQPIVVLVEMQDSALADQIVIVTDDPELDLNTHACPKGCHCRGDYLSADTAADHHGSHSLPWSRRPGRGLTDPLPASFAYSGSRSGSLRTPSIRGLKNFVYAFKYDSSFRCRILQV